MSINYPIPETKVLAIASHVVYGYVGNTMATYVMQALGCEVSAINTVHFSNHTGYRQFTGRRHPASEISDLYTGLQNSHLTDFDMLLSGYAPSADVVQAIGSIARDLRYRRATMGKPGKFFWALDPVMGDQGRLYVDESIVPAYKEVIREADLLLPNQFEVELLSGVSVQSLASARSALETVHKQYGVANVIVTSIKLDKEGEKDRVLTVVGSTKKSDGSARVFKIEVPVLECFFSGTGDMFAALMVVRFREAAIEAGVVDIKSWQSPDEVEAGDLPLARAAEKVLASMQVVLQKTMTAREKELEGWGDGQGKVDEANGAGKRRHLAETKAAEVRLVRNVGDLLNPPGGNYKAVELGG